MDRHKIKFKCYKQPEPGTGLQGYARDRDYVGRSFNGLYQVSPDWGKGKATKLIEEKLFAQYFELV